MLTTCLLTEWVALEIGVVLLLKGHSRLSQILSPLILGRGWFVFPMILLPVLQASPQRCLVPFWLRGHGWQGWNFLYLQMKTSV